MGTGPRSTKMTDWKHGLFGCLSNCDICLCGYCCPCILGYRNAENLGKEGLLYGLLYFVIPCVPSFLLRNEARERYGIEGSTAGDALAAFCCGPCADCQTAAEIEGRGDAN